MHIAHRLRPAKKEEQHSDGRDCHAGANDGFGGDRAGALLEWFVRAVHGGKSKRQRDRFRKQELRGGAIEQSARGRLDRALAESFAGCSRGSEDRDHLVQPDNLENRH